MNPYVQQMIRNSLPDMSTQIANRQQRLTNERKAGIDQMRQIAVQADRIRSIPDFVTQRTEAIKMARDAIANGGKPEAWQPVIDAQNKNEMDLQLTKLFTQNIDSSHYLEQLVENKVRTKTGLASAKTEILEDGSVIQVLPDGSVEVRDPTGRPTTGMARAQTLLNSQNYRRDRLRREADMRVKESRDIARVKENETRRSAIITEVNERARAAARAAPNLQNAMGLIMQARGGLTDVLKQRISQLYPSLDVSNIAALDSSFKRIALDQLQAFKGPTTDFEFGVVQDISGSIGDSPSGNAAKIAALSRMNWLAQEEKRQLDDYDRRDMSMDLFTFNYDKIMLRSGLTGEAIPLGSVLKTARQNHLTMEQTIEIMKSKNPYDRMNELRKRRGF